VIAGLSLMTLEGLDGSIIGAPDLVIVGISDGFASGPQTLHSSAVGAAMTALERGYPTLTVAGIPTISTVEPVEYFSHVANFTINFLSVWLEELPLRRMPEGYGLKLGYPALLPQDIKGVELAENGLYAPISFGYVESPLAESNQYQIASVNSFLEMDDDSEFGLTQQGFISVLPMSSRLALPRNDYNVRFILTLRRMIQDLTVLQDA
jgi:broad specificity polyphosphatase/5'/3'-nucleotidase SurE